MSIFLLKEQLPLETRKELDRVLAIASGLRNSVETAFLAQLDSDYIYNEVLKRNAANEIVTAQGVTVPTDAEGFAKGATFLKIDAADGVRGLYENIGTNTDATWDLVGGIEEADIQDDAVTTSKIEDGAVTTAKIDNDAVTTDKIADEAVTAAKLAEILSLAGKTISLPTATPVNAVASTGVLTLTGAIVPGVHAESVVTANTIIDGDTLTIGATVYRFKTTPDQAFDVALGANDAAALDNLKLAINANGVGDGTDYFAGTTAHPSVVATDNDATTQKVVARLVGTAANTLATTSTGGTLTWADTTLGGGTGASNPGVAAETVTIDDRVYSFVTALSETSGAAAVEDQVLFGADSAAALDNLKLAINNGATEGTNYSTGTAIHATVTATDNSDTEQTVAAKIKGTSGNAIATTETLTNGAWGEVNLESGVNGTVGVQWQIFVNATYLYIAIATNTVADTNWRRMSLGSAY